MRLNQAARVLVVMSLRVPAIPAQQPPAAPSQPLVSASSSEVVLDVLVRDKKGRPVRDLEPSQFEVKDNGAPVKIKTFRLLDRSAAEPAAASPGSKTAADPDKLDPARQLRLFTLLFERLGQDGRLLARRAALDLIKGDPEPNTYYAVFALDQRLSAIQQFTNDRTLLKKAIEHVTGGAATQFASDSERIKHELEEQIGKPANTNGQRQVAQIEEMTGSFSVKAPQAMARMMLAMLQFDQNISAEQGGRASVFGLLSLVREQYRLPGRKTLLYFTEGLHIPESLNEPFRAIISAANRANVSVYAIDSRGLQIGVENQSATDTLRSAADSSRDQATATEGVRPHHAKVFDAAITSMRSNANNSLAELSQSTGGFLVTNSNDLRAPLRRIHEDINSYYEITYVPDIKEFDGSFRKISVRVDRADARVQSRSGYFALPNLGGATLEPFEVAALKALNTRPLPHAFDFRSAALRFRPEAGKVQYAIAFEVANSNLGSNQDPKTSAHAVRVSFLALIKDGQGQVVEKISRDIPAVVSNEKFAPFQNGKIIFTKLVDLPPGRYTLETAIVDRGGDKASARRAVLMVPAPAQHAPALSAIFVVRRIDALQTQPLSADPFEFTGGRVTPSLADPVPATSPARLYFVAYPMKDSADKPNASVEFLRDGAPVARQAPQLATPDANGGVPMLVEAKLEPGEYEVRVALTQGNLRVTEIVPLVVEP